jgi:hypothetical protein
MEEKHTTISLEILVLNDLLRIDAIDKTIYDKVVQRISSKEKDKQAA